MNRVKEIKRLESYFKGAANHWRIEVLLLLNESTNLSLDNIAEELGVNIKTMSEHTKRLADAGLINKTYRNREVLHSLSPYGKEFVRFIKKLNKNKQKL